MYDREKTPCYYCDEHTSSCHSTCNKYIEWKKRHDEKLAKYNKDVAKAKDLIGYDRHLNDQFKKRNYWGKRGKH